MRTVTMAAAPICLSEMDADISFVMKECGCDQARAKTLLEKNRNDPTRAVKHHQKMSSMLASRRHSLVQRAPSMPLPSSEHVRPQSLPPVLPATSGQGGESSPGIVTTSAPMSSSNSSFENIVPEKALPSPDSDIDKRCATPVSDRSSGFQDHTTASAAAEPVLVGSADRQPRDPGAAPAVIAWDFQLPRLPKEEAEDILHPLNPAGTSQGMDMPGAWLAQFNLRELCAAVQQQADLQAIQGYLQDFPDTTVKDRINGTVEGIPSIFYAVEANDASLLHLWAKYDANVSAIHPDSGTPLLAYAIMLSEQLDDRDTSPVVVTLLSLGAPPTCIPDVFYKPYNRDLFEAEVLQAVEGLDEAGRGASNGAGAKQATRAEWQWCRAPEVRRKMARTTHLTQRYHLDRATKLKRPGVRRRQAARLRNAESVLGIPYHLIGQTIAANHLLRKLMTFLTVRAQAPLVLAFVGPSGHGKTELARKLGALLGLDIEVVDCTIFHEERELFGPRAPYVGSERGSPLNNFLEHHAGRPSLVFLDEFEKTSPNIHKALLVPFANGEYQSRRTLATVDCSRTIFILATNALDRTILQFCDDHPDILRLNSGAHAGTEASQAEARLLSKRLANRLRDAGKDHFGAPITGRVSHFIPFLPFSDGEQAVVAHKFALELAERVAGPVLLAPKGRERLLGNVKLRMRRDASVCSKMARDDYNQELGARSLYKAVQELRDELVEVYLDDDREIEEDDSPEKEEFVVDIRADEVVVRKGAS